MKLTPKEFDKIVAEFLGTQDDTIKEESWCTERSNANSVLSDLRMYLFGDQTNREKRRAQYEELKKEFEP